MSDAMTRRWLRGARSVVAASLAAMAVGSSGCSLDSLLKTDKIPPGIADPAFTKTPEGALAAYYGTVGLFQRNFGSYRAVVAASGLLTDELRTGRSLGVQTADAIDLRHVPETNPALLGGGTGQWPLQQVRGQANQAIGLLATYAPERRALLGHTYTLEAYIEVFLAELYCSGIPLSTLDFNGDYTYRPASNTTQVLTHAIALFDTALTLVGDSASFASLAAVGKGRALLDLNDPAGAAAAVADVPDDFRYQLVYDATGIPTFVTANGDVSVADREGGNGLDYISSGDPRTASTAQFTNQAGYVVYRANKYPANGSGPIVVASGVEARLIEAEAALQAGGSTWLTTLNALRTDGAYDTTATTPPDTLWHAGSGGVAGLAPLADPGTAAGRVDLLFRERAFWLFLTGHRQGDLRRLIRQYGRRQEEVFPVGSYPAVSGVPYAYGDDVTLPPPTTEALSNPLYSGCLSRGA